MSAVGPVDPQASPASPRPGEVPGGRAKRSCVVIAVSIVAGLASSWIPWRYSEDVHVIGLPFPIGIFERLPGSDSFADYPFPLALVLNPLACLLAAGVL